MMNMLQQANESQHKIEYGDDFEQEQVDYSHVTKHPYINKLFCWIEAGQTKQVISFFETFPHLINEFHTPNNWNPFMYAVRYANMELIEYFSSKNMQIHVNSIFSHVSVIHSAVYSGDIKILKHVLNVMNCSPNPPNSQTSPLKIAMKIGNTKMVEMLIAKGAYYVFGDVFNNVELKQVQSQQSGKYVSLVTGKDLFNSAVVQDHTVKDCPIKETLRWTRIKQLMFLKKHGQKYLEQKMEEEGKESSFQPMAQLLNKKNHFDLILKMAIGNGDSITKSSEVNQEVKEEKVKQTKTKQK